ncbi:MAG: DUF4136 domain-containing protein [Cellvibrionaceae bacterium]
MNKIKNKANKPKVLLSQTISSFLFIPTLITVLFINGCANQSSIGYSTIPCCKNNSSTVIEGSNYHITTQDMPSFLQEMVSEEFQKAFEEKGFTKKSISSDLTVNLRYQHINLNDDHVDIDPLSRHESMNIELHYIATIIVEIKNTRDGSLLWSGKINRAHRVSPGEYMHGDTARGAFLIAFRNLLKDFPAKK